MRLSAFFAEDGPEPSPLPLEALDPVHLRAFLARDRGRPIAIARQIQALRSLSRFLTLRGDLRHDPTEALTRPKIPARGLPRVLHVDDVALVLEAPSMRTFEGLRDRALLELGYATLLRTSEILALELDDLELDAFGRIGAVQLPGRLVPIGRPAAHALAVYLLRRGLLGPFRERPRALFVHRRRPITAAQVRVIVREAGEAVGIARVTPRVLRDSAAAHLLDGGADLAVVQKILGLRSLPAAARYLAVALAELVKVYLAAHPMARRRAG